MSFNIDWGTSLKEFEMTVYKTNSTVKREINKIIKKTVDEILREVKRLTPSKTGRLRRSWRSMKQGSKKTYSYLIQNNVEYASFVENGSRTVVPVKMLQIAMKKGEQRLDKRLKALGRKLGRDF